MKRLTIDDLEAINRSYKTIRSWLDEDGKIAEQLRERLEIEEEYRNPFHNYDLGNFVKKQREGLIDFVVRELNRQLCPNVSIEPETLKKELDKLGEFEFDALFIRRFIEERFADKADGLSRAEILDKAQNLLPICWENGNRKRPTAESLIDKKKLTLRLYIHKSSWRYEGREQTEYSLDSNSTTNAAAFDKLVGIVLGGEKPSQVVNGRLSKALQHSHQPFYTMEISDRHIVKIRVYKSDRFDVHFDTGENARRVAEALTETAVPDDTAPICFWGEKV